MRAVLKLKSLKSTLLNNLPCKGSGVLRLIAEEVAEGCEKGRIRIMVERVSFAVKETPTSSWLRVDLAERQRSSH